LVDVEIDSTNEHMEKLASWTSCLFRQDQPPAPRSEADTAIHYASNVWLYLSRLNSDLLQVKPHQVATIASQLQGGGSPVGGQPSSLPLPTSPLLRSMSGSSVSRRPSNSSARLLSSSPQPRPAVGKRIMSVDSIDQIAGLSQGGSEDASTPHSPNDELSRLGSPLDTFSDSGYSGTYTAASELDEFAITRPSGMVRRVIDHRVLTYVLLRTSNLRSHCSSTRSPLPDTPSPPWLSLLALSFCLRPPGLP